MARAARTRVRRASVEQLRHPGRAIVGGFAATVMAGAGLLSMPWATSSGHGAGFVDALFAVTSAVRVTGLVTVDTGTYRSGTLRPQFAHASSRRSPLRGQVCRPVPAACGHDPSRIRNWTLSLRPSAPGRSVPALRPGAPTQPRPVASGPHNAAAWAM